MKIEGRRVAKFIEMYSSSFADVEIRSIMNPAVCAGWVVDFFRYLDFEGFKISKVVGNWKESDGQAVRMIYVNEDNEIVLFTVKVNDNFVAIFFEMLKELVVKKSNVSPGRLSDYIEEILFGFSSYGVGVYKAEFTDTAVFALQIGEIGRRLLKEGNYEAWVDWSRWIIQLVKVLKVKELKTLARAAGE